MYLFKLIYCAPFKYTFDKSRVKSWLWKNNELYSSNLAFNRIICWIRELSRTSTQLWMIVKGITMFSIAKTAFMCTVHMRIIIKINLNIVPLIQRIKTFYGEFDPGSGWTLAACLMHASRTRTFGFVWRGKWRTGE